MRINKPWGKITGFLCCFMLLICLPLTVLARGPIEIERKASLTINYPCAGAAFQLYRVAYVSAYGEYSLSEQFSGYPLSLEQADQAGWRAVAATLSGYVARDQLTPLQEGITDAHGKIVFTELTPGLYLLIGKSCMDGDYRYTSDPFLIALPELDADETWLYDVSASPKYVWEAVPDTTELKAVKIWQDDENAGTRPDSIEIQLLCNGTVWDTVTLNEKNSWRHKWEKLDGSYTWQLVEKEVPDGYTVTIQMDGGIFIITNTIQDDPPAPEKPQTPARPLLPQTGVLWWPVGVLVLGGMLLLLGDCIRRKNKYEK